MTQQWRKWPPSIPRDRAARERKLEQIRAERWRPYTQEADREDERRLLEQKAKDFGAGQLV